MNVIKDAMDGILSDMSMSQELKETILQTSRTKYRKHSSNYKRPVVIAVMVTILVLGSTTVGAAINGGWLNEFTRWWSDPIEGRKYDVLKTETSVDGVNIIMYAQNGEFYFELTNASQAIPVICEDSIEIRITKKEESNITLTIPESDALSSISNYEKRYGTPTEGEAIQSYFSYIVVNGIEE